jgi:hypothetical protein
MRCRSIIASTFIAVTLALTLAGPHASAGWLSADAPTLLFNASVEATAGAGASAEWTGMASDMVSQ